MLVNSVSPLQVLRLVYVSQTVLCGLDNFTPEIPNTEYRCGQRSKAL